MNRLQEIILEIMIDIDNLCRAHNINYFLDGGTALGAVRHKGFIPWDDDLDIGMLRPDYNRFLEIAKEEFRGKYFVQTLETESKYYQDFAKIRKNNTLFVEYATRNQDIHHGIFIDVFPFDFAPKNTYKEVLKKTNHIQYIMYHQRISKVSAKPDFSFRYISSNLKQKLRHIKYKFYSKEKLIKEYRVLSEGFNKSLIDKEDDSVIVCHPYRIDDLYFEHDLIFPTREIEFEGHKFYSYNRIHDYLKKIYGNYMEIPKKDDRVTHNPFKIKF